MHIAVALQGLKTRIGKLEEAYSRTLPRSLEPLTRMEWDGIVQRAKQDTTTLDERLEELRKPTAFQDPEHLTKQELLRQEIRTTWLGIFERLAEQQGFHHPIDNRDNKL